jgi:hypothetical protein
VLQNPASASVSATPSRSVISSGFAENPRHRPAGQHRSGEARSLLVAERIDFDREGHALAGVAQRRDRFDAEHDPERPVIAAAVAHAVDMAADDQGRQLGIQPS